MAKPPLHLYKCAHCDAQFTKWSGRCLECGKWGTIAEETSVEASGPSARLAGAVPAKTNSFAGLSEATHAPHVPTGVKVFDRVLSGGLVSGSVTLLGGEPGIGKSTLLAQVGLALATQGKTVLYVTGEESPSQVALRLRRLSPAIPPLFEFLDTTEAATIASTIQNQKPALTIIDSVQTMRLPDVAGESGNPTQMKASAAVVTEAAKKSGSSVILVGQVTKEGELAGPRLLEHLVDTVLMLEGDRDQSFRMLRALKHRFGSSEELAVLSMTEKGLEEVMDPSAVLVADRPKHASGSVITCLAQGGRPLLVEIQALVTPAGYGTPLRRASGIDAARLPLLLAVLGRRVGVSFHDQDVFVNAVGGIDARDSSIDLAICLALISAKLDQPLPADVATWGEVGLSGEVRPVGRPTSRIKEAQRLGFTSLVIPHNKEKSSGATLLACGSIQEAMLQLRLSK